MTGSAPLVNALRVEIGAARLTRIPLDALFNAAHKADPTLLGHPDARARIRAAVDTLTADGTITTPKDSNLWDARAQPALPSWVQRITPHQQPTAGPARIWSGPLAPYAAHATARQLATLEQIEDWRSANPNPAPAPTNERSVHVFGDEKRLNALLGWRLFDGHLPALLNAYEVPLPFATIHVPGARPTGLLIAENVSTWHSIIRTLRARPTDARPDLHVGWGNGGQIERLIASAALLDPTPADIRYFGDLDIAGLRIPIAADRAAQAAGLPPVRPATAMYTALLESTIRRPDRSARGAPDIALLCAWLPENLRAPANTVLTALQRIPQETIGLAELTKRPELLNR